MPKEKKTYKLFLDDVRSVKEAFNYTKFDRFEEEDWLIVRNYTQFIDLIKKTYFSNGEFPEIVAFDHDLADEHYMPQSLWGTDYNVFAENQGFEEKTGYNCAEWLVNFCMDNEVTLPDFYCHSMNPCGKENILGLLNNYRKYENEN